MAGTFTIKNLANGQLALAEADVYLVPAVTTAIIKTITLVNTDTVARTMNLYIKKSAGTSRRIIPKNTNLPAGYSLETDQEYTLGAADAIRGDASAATIVDFTVNGVEET